MKIGVLGTGMVGVAIGTKLIKLGHDVKMGSRTAGNEKAVAWAKANGSKASKGTFADAAAFGEILFHCTKGQYVMEALQAAGAGNMSAKVLVEISNSLDFSKGMPPTLIVCNTDSIGEQIQRAFPETKVVKTLNMVNCNLMVDPGILQEEASMFICGNDAKAKGQVTKILTEWFGWKQVIDLGDISGARGIEMLLPLWIRLMGLWQTPNFGFKIVR